MFDFAEALKTLPERPGVYLMHQGDEIIYVGKAVNLKSRVSQYFRDGADGRVHIQHMMPKVDSFEYIVTDTEMEALLLENNLIKKYQPHYNVLLKDSKQYPYIKVTVGEAFPRIIKTRTLVHDDSRYFGPYTNVAALNETLDLMKELWPLRTCRRNLPKEIGRERPCLEYHLGRCLGPCTGEISEAQYKPLVEEALEMLAGNNEPVKRRLKAEMQAASSELRFEDAARIRDLIEHVESLGEHQKIEKAESEQDRDILALSQSDEGSLVEAFFVRGGKLIGREHFMLESGGEENRAALMRAFISQFYGGTAYVPREILLQEPPEDETLLKEYLSAHRGSKVGFTYPSRGEKLRLLKLCEQNAELTLSAFGRKIKAEEERTTGALTALGRLLGFEDGTLSRIEAYDISNTFGYQSVGSMVAFENGKPKTSDYRKFRIKTVIGANDFASLSEVLRRRFNHGLYEATYLAMEGQDLSLGSFTRLPQLVLMDGGELQVSAAEAVMAEIGLEIPIAGMVKDDRHRTRALLYHGKEIEFGDNRNAFDLITRIQDEAHRFAITYHRSLRDKNTFTSLLDEIPGIGTARKKALLAAFGSVGEIREKSVAELAAVGRMTEQAAQAVYDHFHQAAEEERPYGSPSDSNRKEDEPHA